MGENKKELTYDDLRNEEIPIKKKVEENKPKTITPRRTFIMRTEPNVRSKIMGVFPAGHTVEVLEELEKWLKVRYKIWTGYIEVEE